MTFWGRCTGLAAAVVATACLNDPAAPAVYRLEVRPDTIRFTALGDTIHPLVFAYRSGRYGPAPYVRFHLSDSSVATVNDAGLIASHHVGVVHLVVESSDGMVGQGVVSVTQSVADVSVARDTVQLEALNATAPVNAIAKDALGSPVPGTAFRYHAADSTVASVTPNGLVRAHSNGRTDVWAIAGAESSSTVVRVTQRATQVDLGRDTVRFVAIGVDEAVTATAFDSLGNPLDGSGTIVGISDARVATAIDSNTVRSVGNGSATATFSVAGQIVQLPIVVSQVAQSLTVPAPPGIISVALDSLLPISCEALDVNGSPMQQVPLVQSSAGGRWTGEECGSLRAQRSGIDTLHVSVGQLRVDVPVVIVVRPRVDAVEDVVIQGETEWMGDAWAPSADTAADGSTELYFGNYVYDSTTDDNRANLERLVSSDGLHFQHDTLILPHGVDLNQEDGRGIENAVVFPAADGNGWRMLYAGGNEMSGWAVFGATSVDRRSWTKSGQVIGNGYPNAVRPAGEGLIVDQLPDGSWRLLMGAYEPAPSTTNTFSIAEWRSTDQLTWTFVGSRLSALELPLPGVRVVYSPTIRQLGPSLWRMAFTVDDFSGAASNGGQSNIWSAVSTDFEHWQIEGVLVSAPGANLMYSTLAKDRLYFIRQGADGINHLATAAVQMP